MVGGLLSLSQPLADSSPCRGAEEYGLPRLLRSLAMTRTEVRAQGRRIATARSASQ
nr:MAG TPA: hypothetical protein [Caudoviricetes sp.]